MSSNSIVINGSKSVVAGSSNSKYRYYFNNPQYFTKYDQIALNICNIYFSWFNVTSAYNNNSFQYQWFGTTNSTMQTFNVSFSDSYMSVSDMNEYLILLMVSRGHYTTETIAGVTSKVYYIKILENSNYYAIEFDISPMPSTTASSARGVPTDSTPQWVVPAATKTPIVIINSTNTFGDLVGFSPGNYPSSTKSTYQVFLSDKTPTINPVSSILMSCNLITNNYSVPNNILYAFTSAKTAFGGMVEISPNEKTYDNIQEGTYSYIEITFYDQDLNLLKILDTDLMIMLNLRKDK